jgi:hypothetical protein
VGNSPCAMQDYKEDETMDYTDTLYLEARRFIDSQPNTIIQEWLAADPYEGDDND